MIVNKLTVLGIVGFTLLIAGLVQAHDTAESQHTADDARPLIQQPCECNQARLQLEQRLNAGQDAGNADGIRGDGFRYRAVSTRFGQGYESRMSGAQRSGSASTGGRR